MKSYFKEIVRNANKSGDKIDMSLYQNVVSEYSKQALTRKKPDIQELEAEVLGVASQSKRRAGVAVPTSSGQSRNLNNDLE